MNRWKTYTSIFFLALLSLSVLPKELWHDCEHEELELADGFHTEITAEAECAVCDHHFSSYSPTTTPAIALVATAEEEFLLETPSAIKPTDLLAFSSRGPPAC